MLAGTHEGVYGIASPTQSWMPLGLDGITVRDIVVDGSRWIAATDEGVFVSTNGGTTWTELPGLANKRPQTLLLRANGELVVGTTGFGVFRLIP